MWWRTAMDCLHEPHGYLVVDTQRTEHPHRALSGLSAPCTAAVWELTPPSSKGASSSVQPPLRDVASSAELIAKFSPSVSCFPQLSLHCRTSEGPKLSHEDLYTDDLFRGHECR